MSLVLEALRRIDKSDGKTGSIGVAVSSYRPARRRPALTLPLLLGLATGAALLLLFKPRPADPPRSRALSPSVNALPGAPPPASSTALAEARFQAAASASPPRPPARELEAPRSRSAAPATPAESREPSRGPDRSRSIVSDRSRPASLTLQAISERDSSPIAIINDQLVREGDLIGGIRILRIDSDSVEVLLESGKRETVRFAPPPSQDPRPTLVPALDH